MLPKERLFSSRHCPGGRSRSPAATEEQSVGHSVATPGASSCARQTAHVPSPGSSYRTEHPLRCWDLKNSQPGNDQRGQNSLVKPLTVQTRRRGPEGEPSMGTVRAGTREEKHVPGRVGTCARPPGAEPSSPRWTRATWGGHLLQGSPLASGRQEPQQECPVGRCKY